MSLSGSPSGTVPVRERIVVAMSGGVDSSVAAALLLEAGHDVIGVFMRNGVASEPGRGRRQGCCGVDDAHDARRVSDRLGIPFYALDLEAGFEGLIDDFVTAYVQGRTPNPCVECNRRFKLGSVLQLAKSLGAAAIATGHYGAIVEQDGRFAVHRAKDRSKDQAYVLYALDQEALQRLRLPIGDLSKAVVRELARSRRLPVAEKPESMEICFVPSGDYRDVVRARAPEALISGPIVDQDGRKIGEHGGTALFTIGQRKGLPSGQREPIFVTEIDTAERTIRVGRRADVEQQGLLAGELVWSGMREPEAGASFRTEVMIRAHHEAAPATATVNDDGTLQIRFDSPQIAITPGQSAVCFQGERMLVGGSILRPIKGSRSEAVSLDV